MKRVLDELQAASGTAVVATVVRVEGSAYQHAGAKLLIPEVGPGLGMLSGGCLEDDVREKARLTFSEGVPQVLAYDMRGDDDAFWGLNLGCNGLVEILVERVGAVLEATAAEYRAGRPCVSMAVLSEGPHLGRRLLLRQDDSTAGSLGDPTLDRLALAAARSADVAHVTSLAGTAVYIEPVVPSPVLWVVGAGNDAPPLVRVADGASWRVRVVDRRPKYADPARFPEADEVMQMEPEELARRVEPGDFAVLMHHNFDHDRDYMTALLQTGVRYIGALGPLRRTQRLLGTAALPPSVYAPIGLDLGGDGPEAVAVCIVAELQAVLHGRSGGHLRGSSEPIHACKAMFSK